ncbi:MAG: peptidoglycan D,D-transpeptidase FtsI family protein [Desulfotomaculales bacterium]
MSVPEKQRCVQFFFVLALLFALLCARLAAIQLWQGKSYAAEALTRETVTLPLEEFPRGEILDRKLRPLTRGVPVTRVAVFPQAMADPGAVAAELARLLGAGREEIYRELQSARVLPGEITPAQAKAIRERNLPGVLVVPYYRRYGPDPLAAQVTGYLGRPQPGEQPVAGNGGGWVGRTGLERYYDQKLAGGQPRGYARLYTDAAGRWLRGRGIEVVWDAPGSTRKDVVTTIDADIQEIVERVMDARVKNGAVVVLDPVNGDILALASRPRYNPDPGKIAGYLTEKEALLDQGTSLFAPGSLFKVVVAAAALAEGVVTPETVFTCRGKDDWPVRCWSEEGHGTLSFAQAFAQSCNPVFARLALNLGAEKLIAYARLFGLDSQEIAGYPVPPDQRQDLDLIAAPGNLVNSSLGQGPVLATPVQVAAMLGTIANGGKYCPPRLVRELRTEGGEVVQSFSAGPPRQVLSPEVTRQLQEMLFLTTSAGIGQKAFLEGWGSAGKTGSAQVGGGAVNAWFCGYTPVDRPKYVVAVLVKNGGSGSEAAAPVFKAVTEQIRELDLSGRL